MRAGFKAAGFQVLTDSKYLTSQNYLMPGDILLNDTNHTATNIGIGKNSGYSQNVVVKDSAANKKSLDEIAKEIATNPNHPWGNGDTRIQRLAAAGYTSAEISSIQNKINDLMRGTSSKPASTSPAAVPTYTSGTYSKTIARNGKVTANLLNIRMKPTIRSNNLTSYPILKYGTIVGVCMQTKDEDGDFWYYIRITGNKG